MKKLILIMALLVIPVSYSNAEIVKIIANDKYDIYIDGDAIDISEYPMVQLDYYMRFNNSPESINYRREQYDFVPFPDNIKTIIVDTYFYCEDTELYRIMTFKVYDANKYILKSLTPNEYFTIGKNTIASEIHSIVCPN
ncbi:hypothetical protein GW796_05835 [archaeon]|nr:hypothetical protein [archaeon]NCQ51405.1 hypothetical protein [archaeon]NCT58769.1 hypothetical protein [archaeon]